MNERRAITSHASGPLALEITFRITAAHRVEFLQTLEGLLSGQKTSEKTAEIGCFEQVDGSNTFLWRECWDSEEELNRRLRTERMKALMGAIGVLGKLQRMEILAISGRSRSEIVWT